MRNFQYLLVCALFLTGAASPARAAQPDLPLARVAASSGLTYGWLAAERAVSLTGPGIVIVIRPGMNLYEVDDLGASDGRVESTASTPRYANNDIYVSASFAEHITQLARQAQLRMQSAARPQNAYRVAAVPAAPTVSGAIVLNVHQLAGAEALVVSGQAPPTAPVMITLLATLSSDVPVVVVGRHNVDTDANGNFQAVVPIGPDYVRNSYLKVLATSVPSVASASAQVLLGPINPGNDVAPFEQQPGSIW